VIAKIVGNSYLSLVALIIGMTPPIPSNIKKEKPIVFQ
jgi:hypothetical protein